MQLEHQDSSKQPAWLFGLVVTAILLTMAYIGGTPTADKVPLFVLGVAITIGGIVVIGLAGWHLLVRPLPQGQKVLQQQLITGQARYFLSLLMVIGLLNIVFGSMWDEIWHIKYGIPFGEDFFWRPHQMLYFGFLVTIGVAAWGIFAVLTKGKGTMQQRFRADAPIGLAIMSGAFLAFALPADPAWHMLYGEDLSAWAIPHVVLLLMVLVSAISIVVMLLSNGAKLPQWSTISRMNASDVLMVITLASLFVTFVLLLLVEWYSRLNDGNFNDFTLSSAPWVFPSLITICAVLIGGTALFSTRRIGIATLVFVWALGTRWFMEQIVGAPYTGTAPYMVMIPLVVTLDVLAYYFMLQRKETPNRLIVAGALTLSMGIFGIPIMNAIFGYPELTLTSVPMILIATFIVSYGMVWIAEGISRFIWNLVEIGQPLEAEPVSASRSLILNGAIYAAFALFAAFLFFTAAPPV